ncbi:MAG: hypothetical protein N2746_01940 [Deltaproteobacteria bacterium]|nr:hypothetical protein [Deltaproteobacteria bacterium]
MMRATIILLFTLCLSSCGENQGGYNFVYLQYNKNELMYVFNRSEYHLCYGSDVEICQKRYSISKLSGSTKCNAKTKSCSGYYSYRYIFSPDDDFTISTAYDDDLRNVIVTNREGDVVFYSTDYFSSSTYITSVPISSSQHTGFCDVSIIESMLNQMIQNRYGYSYNITLDYNSLTMNPDVCRLAQLINCIAILFPSIDVTDDVLSKTTSQALLRCFMTVYSLYGTDPGGKSSLDIDFD